MKCKCEVTMQFMRDIGASHAAQMHLNPDKNWTSEDWIIHFNEERKYLYPLIVKYFTESSAIIRDLEQQHFIFLNEIAIWGEIRSKELLIRHSLYEDDLVGKLARFLKKSYAA